MSYLKPPARRRPRPRPTQLSGAVDDVAKVAKAVIDKAAPALKAAGKVLEDPALPEVSKLVLKLHDIEQRRAKPKVPGQPSKPSAPVKGVGLARVVKPLKIFVEVREKSWILPVAIGVAVLVPFTLGYFVGKGRKR